MKILAVNYTIPNDIKVKYGINLAYGNFSQTTPFGYNTLVVDPISANYLVGSDRLDTINTVIMRWRGYLEDWLSQGNTIVVIHRPYSREANNISNYSWIPLRDSMLLRDKSESTGGDTKHIGSVIVHSDIFSTFISENAFQVLSYYDYDKDIDQIVHPISQIVGNRLTSFSIKQDGWGSIYFIPMPESKEKLIDFLETNSNQNLSMSIKQLEILESELAGAQSEVEVAQAKLKASSSKLDKVRGVITNLISLDVYLEKANRLYQTTKASQAPDPRDYYEAVENIEKAFGGERKMREALKISKGKHDLLMKRTNEFRHASTEGVDPTPLTPEEIVEFNTLTAQIIEAYLQHLYNLHESKMEAALLP